MSPLQPQINELKRRLDAHEGRMDDADAMRAETHAMVSQIHHALMQPQYGQGDKSLLQRMADVTVAIETGDRATESLVRWLKRLAILGIAITGLGAILVKLEIWKGTP
jgi:hypothetical protein